MPSLLETLTERCSRPRRGPKVEVPLYKLILLMRIVSLEEPIGRYLLVERVGLGEGVVRSILSMLAKHGVLRPLRGRGCMLTPEGRRQLQALLNKYGVVGVEVVSPPQLDMGRFEVAAHVKGAASRVRLGVEQRDEAIKVGAQGALTLVFKEGRLVIPGVEESLEDVNPSLAKTLSSLFKLEEGDVVIICSSDERWKAEEAALATALSLARLSCSSSQ